MSSKVSRRRLLKMFGLAGVALAATPVLAKTSAFSLPSAPQKGVAAAAPQSSAAGSEGEDLVLHMRGDTVADNTDLYAFVSPDAPDTVTFISNFVPLQNPAGGPNFYSFGDDVQYAINIDNDHDGVTDISYVFSFTTTYQNTGTFLYNTGPISSLTDRATSPQSRRRLAHTSVQTICCRVLGVVVV